MLFRFLWCGETAPDVPYQREGWDTCCFLSRSRAGVGDMPTGGGGKKEHFLLVDVLGKKPDFMATNWKHHTSTYSFKR